MARNIIKEGSYRIVNGPSRSDLFNATQYAYDKDKHFYVTFTLEDGKTFKLQPVTIGHEDGSGYSLNISGYVRESQLPIVPAHGGVCQLYYHARRREGSIIVSHEEW